MSEQAGYILVASTPELDANRSVNAGVLSREFMIKASNVIDENEPQLAALVEDLKGSYFVINMSTVGVWVAEEKTAEFEAAMQESGLPFKVTKEADTDYAQLPENNMDS